MNRYPNSQEWWERASKVIPLGTQTMSKHPSQWVQGAHPTHLVRGQGAHLWDTDGHEWVDEPMALGPIILGYAEPSVNDAIRAQLDDGITFTLMHPLEVEVAERIVAMCPGVEAVRFAKSGSDALTGAIRAAHAHTGRDLVLAGGYHGWHDWYIGSTTRDRGVPKAVADLTLAFPYGDLDRLAALLEQHAGQVAAVVLEPSGLTVPPPGYLQGVIDLCHRHGALSVFDEVIVGFRVAPGGARERYGVQPDLSCYGKALGNGMPIAAVGGRWEVMHQFEEIFFSGTHGGEALSLAAARSVLDTLADGTVLAGIEARGQRLQDGVAELIAGHGVDGVITVSGEPHRSVVSISGDEPLVTKSWVQQCQARAGCLFNGSLFVCARHTDDDVAQILSGFDAAFAEIARGTDLRPQLDGDPVQPVFPRPVTDGPTVLVIGAGSIGRRHTANLVAAGAVVSVGDLDRDRATAVASETGATAVDLDLDRLVAADGGVPTGVVVASPTSLHRRHAEAALATGARVMVEKPLATVPADAEAVAAVAADRLAVAHNLRFHEPLRRVATLVHDGAAGDVTAVRLWFGSWLPDWRPGTDYRTSYSARSELGGGVLLDAIHELDLLVWLLGRGPHVVVGAIVERLGPLEIDVEDTVKALVRAEGGASVEISLDYLARRYRRGVEVTGDRATIRFDWARQVIEVEDADGLLSEPVDTPVDRSYEGQDAAFVAWLAGGPPLPVDGAEALASVALAQQIPRRRPMTDRVVVLVQARTGSTRLPGKVLADIAGRPMLGFMLERLKPLQAQGIDLAVATSDLDRDDAVADVAAQAGVGVVRGSEADVLDRMTLGLDQFRADLVVRLTADCPLADPALVAQVIAAHTHAGADYTSNTLVRTYPDGLDVEVLTADVLRTATAEAVDLAEREHVTPFVIRRPHRFHLAQVTDPLRLGRERWTVDTPADLDVVRSAVGRLDDPIAAPWRDILEVLGRHHHDGPNELVAEPDLTIAHEPGRDYVRAWDLSRDGVPAGRGEIAVDDGRGELALTTARADRPDAEVAIRAHLRADQQVAELTVS